ncbi:MAG: ABC transporter permease [Chloroflexi bacterium]|nr:ABC transporter permease [Chloroflexota bacterium]
MDRRKFLRYGLRRLAVYLLTIWGAFTIAFVFFRLIPGDPIELYYRELQAEGFSGESAVNDAAAETIRERIGIDGTIIEQYFRFMGNVIFRAEFGGSILAVGTPVRDLILRALPWTIGLLGLSVLIGWVLGVIVGGLVGWARNSPFANGLTTISIALSQVPQYIAALALLYLFAFTLAWFPVRNAYPGTVIPGFNLDFIVGVIRHGTLPALAIIIVSVSGWILSTRSLVVLILGEDYLQYAQSKGLPRGYLFTNYVLRNALLPQITALAISLGFIVNGALLIETLFSYPGLGLLLQRAVTQLDYNTIQAIVLISILSVLTANFLLDLVLPFIDPRVRTQEMG